MGNEIWLLMNYKKGRELECSNFKYKDATFKYFERSFIYFLEFYLCLLILLLQGYIRGKNIVL